MARWADCFAVVPVYLFVEMTHHLPAADCLQAMRRQYSNRFFAGQPPLYFMMVEACGYHQAADLLAELDRWLGQRITLPMWHRCVTRALGRSGISAPTDGTGDRHRPANDVFAIASQHGARPRIELAVELNECGAVAAAMGRIPSDRSIAGAFAAALRLRHLRVAGHILWHVLHRLCLRPSRPTGRSGEHSVALLLLRADHPSCTVSHRALFAQSPESVDLSSFTWLESATIPDSVQLLCFSGASLLDCLGRFQDHLRDVLQSPSGSADAYAPRGVTLAATPQSFEELPVRTHAVSTLCITCSPTSTAATVAALHHHPLLKALTITGSAATNAEVEALAASLQHVLQLTTGRGSIFP